MARMQRVRATRSFRHAFEALGEGSVIDLELPVAQELEAAMKVEFVAGDTKLAKVPVAKREKAPAKEITRIAALEAQIAGLAGMVEKLTAGKRPREQANVA